MSKARDNYNQTYYQWYRKIGNFGGIINKRKFEKYIDSNDTVLDFGCGGGFLLGNLNCAVKHGVEINLSALEDARKNSVKIISDSSELSNEYYDKIISNHTLQHCEDPLRELQNLNRSLKKNGLIIIVTACSSKDLSYKSNDVNYQLYSWSPMNLGNILDAAGFEVIEIKKYTFRWLPKYQLFYKIFGAKIFNFFCYIYGFFNTKISDIIAVAKKSG